MFTNLCEAATKEWYSEIKKYDYDDSKIHLGTGHFTQVVWESSKKLGCGIGKR